MSGERKIYETDNDLANEAEVVTFLQKAWILDFIKLPYKDRFDYMLLEGDKPKGFVEIKCTTYPIERHKFYLMSMDKFVWSHVIESATELPVYLVVRWTDKLGVARMKKCDFFGFGGRTDRNDIQDLEPVAYYAKARFKKLYDFNVLKEEI